MSVNPPHIREVPYSRDGVTQFVDNLASTPGAPETTYLLTYPTVYVIKDSQDSSCEIYIGEEGVRWFVCEGIPTHQGVEPE